ncbi:MAG: acyl-ACP--UDP-N-acetylglucosamine O-acyltransferase [Candidatus Auribacterota bacterium]|jgi:UDP-N-acetylglucosamine acyltransferase|nr:acyl-ACP--UDP-N-acetylglucosamine O-acyltransferase [Candidatus Auribacterota bacterium]
MAVHPTAIIGDSVNMADDVQIGPYVVIDGEVSIGRGTKVMAHANITGYTQIGENCEIHMGVVLGHEPQDLVFSKETSFLKIGDNNVFREYSWVHRGTKPGSCTTIGNNNYFMGFSHVAHNCVIGNNTIIASNALLAGYVEVGDRAFVSGNIVVHQFTRIGAYAMVSGLSAVNKDIPPYMLAGGRPAVVTGLNVVGLRRNGFNADQRRSIKQAHDILFRQRLATKRAVEALKELPQSSEVDTIIRFIETSQRGLCSSTASRHAQPFGSDDE